MNYSRVYNQLISKRQTNKAEGYTERHHIVPKCMGGADDDSNTVVLTGREHWIAHLLLFKIHGGSRLACACHMMAMRCEERGIPRIKNSRMYELVRKKISEQASINGKKRIGAQNGAYGTMWISNVELKQNKKIKKHEAIPAGWIKGRNKWVKKAKPKKIGRPCKAKPPKICKRALFQKRIKEKYLTLFNKFKAGNYASLSEFHRLEVDNITEQALAYGFRKFVPEYRYRNKFHISSKDLEQE